MVDDSKTNGFLAEPAQPGAFRVCMTCRSWFALKLVSKREDELQGSIATYRCKKCDATFDFAKDHPPDAI